jgi:dsRNA-specific ribonuclease
MKENEEKKKIVQQEADFELKQEEGEESEKKQEKENKPEKKLKKKIESEKKPEKESEKKPEKENESEEMQDDIKTAEAALSYTFQNKILFSEAQHQKLNKKMAFFGDAVLDLAASEYLYYNYVKLEQGELTNLKSLLVCDEKLEAIVKREKWDEWIIIEKGILEKTKKIRSTFLEAIVGAIYLDGGSEPAGRFIHKYIVNKKEAEKEIKNLVSPKVRLYEFCQQQYNGFRPISYLISEEGPAHDRLFEMGYMLPPEITGLDFEIEEIGKGKTKADAETKAAEKINKKLIRLKLMEKKTAK